MEKFIEKIEIINLKKNYNDKVIFDKFSLEIEKDTITSIIGASGGGKTTLLNIIAGILPYDSGEIRGINNEAISYIFQEDRLIPWLTIEENLEITLRNYYKDNELKKKINYYLNLVGVKGENSSYPNELSGGMKQRINIARALGKPSKVILMDEPFKSLDYKTKYKIMDEFIDIMKKEQRTVIFVTHDVDEAIYFGGSIVVLGGSPLEVKCKTEGKEKNKDEIINYI